MKQSDTNANRSGSRMFVGNESQNRPADNRQPEQGIEYAFRQRHGAGGVKN